MNIFMTKEDEENNGTAEQQPKGELVVYNGILSAPTQNEFISDAMKLYG